MEAGGTTTDVGHQSNPEGSLIKMGYLKKLKTMKKKFFVLHGDTREKSARLEYYDTEKKWKSNSSPKKSILLKNCFNITRRLDMRQKHVIALYTRKECLCVVAETEEELADWLAALLELLHPADALMNSPQPSQLVWQVNIQKKGLGASRNIVGNYTLRLTDKSLILSKLRSAKGSHHQGPMDYIEYSLSSIRRCGDSESFFYMEVGRCSVTGAGELWMHTEDPNIAKSMHTTVLMAMSNSSNAKDELDPKSRLRSASATEASKPISMLSRRQTYQGTKSHGLSPSSESALCSGRSCVGLCLSPCENQSAAYCAPQTIQETQEAPQQPPGIQNGTRAHKEDSNVMLNISHERTRSLPLTGEETSSMIPGGNLMKTLSMDKAGSFTTTECRLLQCCNGSYLHHSKKKPMSFGGVRRASTGCRLSGFAHIPCMGSGHGILAGGGNVRERCDSLPSRGNTPGGATVSRVPPPHPSSGVPQGHTHRPHSMYIRGISHSPPANSPLSPHSAGGAYSTDSAGSSVSIDETDNFSHPGMFLDDASHMNHARLINSRTPDERSIPIPEEATDDSLVLWQPEKSLSESLEKGGHAHKYMYSSMEKGFSFGSGIFKDLRKSSIGGVPEMGSPIFVPNMGTSPQEQLGYIPMSPASADPMRLMHCRGNSSNHSRTSSLAEDFPDGGVKVEEGYVDMEPNKDTHAMSPAASISSVTQNTDIRFPEFHLDKVSSYFGPECENRPHRAYSVGSRPDNVKKIINRHDIHMSAVESSRTRAFSCGSKSRNSRDNRILNHGTPPQSHIHHFMNSGSTGNKSSSTPILGTGSLYRHAYNSSHSSVEPLDDLMEMDFSNRTESSTSVKTEMPPPPAPAPAPAPLPPVVHNEGYMDMAPVAVTSGYVEMKPADSSLSDPVVTHKLLTEAVRKISITKPHCEPGDRVHGMDTLQPQEKTTADGYVEMSWNNPKSVLDPRSRVPSRPISINTNIPKDVNPVSSASPVFSTTTLRSFARDSTEKADVTTSMMSPGTSPISVIPFTPSPISSLIKSKKPQSRSDSIELQTPTSQPQTIFPFSPGSPVKFCPIKSPLSDSTPTESNSSFDVTPYMEMAPVRLPTVLEFETSMRSVDKNIKQMMNNATKVSSDNKNSLSNITSSQITQHKTEEESSNKTKSSNNATQSINTPTKFQCMPIKVPAFAPNPTMASRNIDTNGKENEDILSSNPTAIKTLSANTFNNKPNTNNSNHLQGVKKTVLIINHTQPITPDFKPIQSYDIEQKCVKSGSPKQCESVLNRQLMYYDNKTRSQKEDPCDGYELLSQNGQIQKASSRPGSVNNNKGKKESGSGSRPPSVNSEGGGSKEKSRPSSVSSEIGGTPCGSRPGSVVGKTEQLNYVHLDLNPPPNTNPPKPIEPSRYSVIDFAKCEEMKNSKNLAAKSTN